MKKKFIVAGSLSCTLLSGVSIQAGEHTVIQNKGYAAIRDLRRLIETKLPECAGFWSACKARKGAHSCAV